MPGNSDSYQSILSDAHQLRQYGRYVQSWERLEDLEPIDRVMPETLALRLQLCADLGKWAMGENILGVLATAADETHKITCAEWLHCFARHLVATGEICKAKQAVKHVVELWQPIWFEGGGCAGRDLVKSIALRWAAFRLDGFLRFPQKKLKTGWVSIAKRIMPLIRCKECGGRVSTEAEACPSCGKPNKKVKNRAQNSIQSVGCLIFIIGILLCIFLPIIGIPMAIVGLIIGLVNTRII